MFSKAANAHFDLYCDCLTNHAGFFLKVGETMRTLENYNVR